MPVPTSQTTAKFGTALFGHFVFGTERQGTDRLPQHQENDTLRQNPWTRRTVATTTWTPR